MCFKVSSIMLMEEGSCVKMVAWNGGWRLSNCQFHECQWIDSGYHNSTTSSAQSMLCECVISEWYVLVGVLLRFIFVVKKVKFFPAHRALLICASWTLSQVVVIGPIKCQKLVSVCILSRIVINVMKFWLPVNIG